MCRHGAFAARFSKFWISRLFADFSSSRKVKLVGRTYRFAAGLGLTTIGKNALIFTRVWKRFWESSGAEILDFYSIFYPIAEGYARRPRKP